MRKEVTVGQGRLACLCPMSAIRSQMGLRDGMGWKEAGQGEMTGILFWTPALSSSMSQSVSQSVSRLNRCQCQYQCQCWTIQTHCRFSSTTFHGGSRPGGRATEPPIENVTSARPSKSPGGPLSHHLASPIDRPAVSDLSCCRVVGGVVGGTHSPREDPRNPRSQDPRPSSSIHLYSPPSDRHSCSNVHRRAVFSSRLSSHSRHWPDWDPASETPARGLRGRCGLLSSLLLVSESWAEWIAVAARKMGRSLHYE